MAGSRRIHDVYRTYDRDKDRWEWVFEVIITKVIAYRFGSREIAEAARNKLLVEEKENKE